jgi:hypothetical protein
MIYIAAPYSHVDEFVIAQRVHMVNMYAAFLVKSGYIVYSPITMSHPLTTFGLKGDWATWEKQDKHFLLHCSFFHVLQLTGWRESKGLANELVLANYYNKQIRYIELVINEGYLRAVLVRNESQ